MSDKNSSPRKKAVSHRFNNNDFLYTLVYNYYMKKAPLIKTNPYLRDPVKRGKDIISSVASSSAIEGIKCGIVSDRFLEKTKKAETSE